MQVADAEAEMELQPETASFRKAQLMRWQTLRDALTDPGGGPDPGELRAFLATLLTRAPVHAVAQFLASTPTWRRGDGELLNAHEAGAELIQCAYPRPTWSRTPGLTREAAADPRAWREWIRRWSADFSATGEAAQLVLAGRGGTLVDLLRMKGIAMLDNKNALLTILSVGQVALQVYHAADRHRQERLSGGEPAPAPMTIEAVMAAAQCHIPKLKDALTGLMGDAEQTGKCVDAIIENPDLAAILSTLSGLRAPRPRPAPGPPPPAATTPGAPPTSPPSPAPAPEPRGATPPTSAPLQPYRPEYRSRQPGAPPTETWTAVFQVRRPDPPAPASPDTADEAPREPPIAPPQPPPGTPDPAPAAPAPAAPEPSLAQELTELEHWVHERSREARRRGDCFAARLDAFLAAASLAASGTPAPGFQDPADTAEAIAAATRIQPTHFGDDDAQLQDRHIRTLVEQTKRRLERRYELDDQFLAWLEERFEAVQIAAQRRPQASASPAT